MNTEDKTNQNQPKGIFIPFEVLQMDLKADEKIVLSIIAYYTEKGKSHACYLTNEQIAEMTGISYYLIRDRIKPALRKKELIASNGGVKNKSLVNLYRETTTLENNNLYRETTTLENETPSSNNDGVSSNDDGNLYREMTMGGYREMTIQNKERKIKENKEKNKTDYSKTYLNTGEGVDAFSFPLDCGEVEPSDTSTETTPTTLESLCRLYQVNGDSLPLLQYLQEHTSVEVYNRIQCEFKDDEKELEGLGVFARNIGMDLNKETNDTSSNERETTPSDDWLINDDTPSPKQIAEAKRERVERISKRFFQAVERHLKEKTAPSQNDIDKVSARLDEIGCKEARQLKRVMDDVLKEYFNGVCVYNPTQTETPSQVPAYTPTDRTRKAVSNDLPF